MYLIDVFFYLFYSEKNKISNEFQCIAGIKIIFLYRESANNHSGIIQSNLSTMAPATLGQRKVAVMRRLGCNMTTIFF